MRDLLNRLVAGTPPESSPLTHVEELPERAGCTADWPIWAPGELRARLASDGIVTPWSHQTQAAQLAHEGHHVVVATGTASGKSLAYQLPGLTALFEDDRARVLYLAPTKALAGDQLRTLHELDLPWLRAAAYDGDTPLEERDWVRAHANWVLTNPDMLHRGILPTHQRWATFLMGRLFFVLVKQYRILAMKADILSRVMSERGFQLLKR